MSSTLYYIIHHCLYCWGDEHDNKLLMRFDTAFVTVSREPEESSRLTCSSGSWIIRNDSWWALFRYKNNLGVWICINILESRSWDSIGIYCSRARWGDESLMKILYKQRKSHCLQFLEWMIGLNTKLFFGLIWEILCIIYSNSSNIMYTNTGGPEPNCRDQFGFVEFHCFFIWIMFNMCRYIIDWIV